ncbi:MAG: CheR family methyltransferase [Bacteroidales bacterium]
MIREDLLFEISEKIIQLLGLHFQSNQFIDLERRMKAAAKELGQDDHISSIHEWMQKSVFNHQELNVLSAHLTINETYFFREKPALELFQERIIPQLIEERRASGKSIRIWCAGCSSGEEPYTLAIILKHFFPQLSDWNVTILATDISPTAIQKALLGEYTDWSFRETESAIKERYFTPSGKNWLISPEIKKMVTFSYLNLSKNAYPSSLTNTENMDVIFCRNVMMYFTPKVTHEVSARFRQSIIENGWFITSQVELNDEYFGNFGRITYNSGIFYQKSDISKQVSLRSTTIAPNIKPTKPRIAPTLQLKKKEVAKPFKSEQKTEIKKQEPVVHPDLLFQKGEYDECISTCIAQIETGRLNIENFTLLVKSLANIGKLKEGDKIIQKIITSYSATAEMYYIYATFLKEHNELTESEGLLKKAVYLNHQHVLSHLMLGELNLKKENHTVAAKYYEQVIRLLNNYSTDEIVPDSDGMTAGRIKSLAESILYTI